MRQIADPALIPQENWNARPDDDQLQAEHDSFNIQSPGDSPHDRCGSKANNILSRRKSTFEAVNPAFSIGKTMTADSLQKDSDEYLW